MINKTNKSYLKKQLNKKTLYKEFILNHYGFILSISFLYLSMLGLLYDILYYGSLDINILNYSNTEDFIFSWVRSISGPYFIALIMFLLLLHYIAVITKENENLKKLCNYILNNKYYIILSFVFFVLLELYIFKTYFIMVIVVFFTIFLESNYRNRKNKTNIFKDTISRIILVCIYIINSALVDNIYIKEDLVSYHYNIKLNNGSEEKNDCILIGIKSNFQIYKKDKKILIFPINNIISIERINNKNYQTDNFKNFKIFLETPILEKIEWVININKEIYKNYLLIQL